MGIKKRFFAAYEDVKKLRNDKMQVAELLLKNPRKVRQVFEADVKTFHRSSFRFFTSYNMLIC